MAGVDTDLELYVAPEATGVHDWYPFVPLATESVTVKRGQDDLSDDPTPGQSVCFVRDPLGNLNPENPMGVYYGSIDRGTPQRILLRRGADSFSVNSSNSWAGLWANGLGSGGTVAATDWSVSSGTARHSLPVANARRVSDYNLANQIQADAEVRTTVTFPVASASGGPLITEIWFRVNANGWCAAQLYVQPGGGLSIGFYDLFNGVTRTLQSTKTTGLSNLTTQTWKIAAQVEGMSMRIKVWAATSPEPLDWTATTSSVANRRGYVSISSFVDTGNTNTKPLVFQYDDFLLRLPVFTGELTDIRPSGDDKSGGVKKVRLQAHDVLNRLQAPGSPEESFMRRSRSRDRRWWYIAGPTVNTTGAVNTARVPTADVPDVIVGDIISLLAFGTRKEDTIFRITNVASGGGNTTFTFTPDARSSVLSGDVLAIFRESPPDGVPIGYWPMEEGNQSTQVESGRVGGQPGVVTIGAPDFGADSSFPTSKPVMKMNGAEMKFPIPSYSSTVCTTVVNIAMPEVDEPASGQNLFDLVIKNGTARFAAVRYETGGSLRVVFSDPAGVVLHQSGALGFSMQGNPSQITFRLEQIAGQVYWYLATTTLSDALAGVGPTAATGITAVGTAETIRVNPGGGYEQVGVGHLTFAPSRWDLYTTYFDINGWRNRAGIQRLLRTCWEERIPASYWDNWDVVTTSMGQQKTDTVYTWLKQITETDGGFLNGPKGELGLNLRTRGSLYNQDPMFTVHGGTGGHIDEPFDPTFDYAETVNRVTVDRIDGATIVRELTSGRLSTAMPPAGIGYREKQLTISAGSDLLAGLLADEQLNTGVIRKPRVKELVLRPAAKNSITVEQMADITIGARVDVDTLNTRNVYGTLSQIVVGYELELSSRFDPHLRINCTRYAPYQAFALTGDDRARPDGFDTVMVSTTNTTQLTNFFIDSASGMFRWTTRVSDFPVLLDIAGEHVWVSGITGAGTAQQLTVTQRSVNGVVKSHTNGHAVKLANPNRAARR